MVANQKITELKVWSNFGALHGSRRSGPYFLREANGRGILDPKKALVRIERRLDLSGCFSCEKIQIPFNRVCRLGW